MNKQKKNTNQYKLKQFVKLLKWREHKQNEFTSSMKKLKKSEVQELNTNIYVAIKATKQADQGKNIYNNI